ncbi:MAG: hypothetical protein PHF72_14160 [Gammaproteobacteria bacterium]|nr:hypothetical protein [Gammaproteobacteria bacterium]
MFGFDLGVSLAFGLSILSLLLCVGWGVRFWNSGGGDGAAGASEWAREEDALNEEL